MSHILVFVLFAFSINTSFASQQVLTCGWVIDLNQPEGMSMCEGPVEACGLKVAENTLLQPWMELWLAAGSQLPSLTILPKYNDAENFVVSFWGLSSQGSEMLDFQLVGESLSFQLNSTVGKKGWFLDKGEVLNFKIKASMAETTIQRAAFFKGKIIADSQDGDGQAFGCLYQ